MIKVRSIFANVAAGTTDQLLTTITTPDGHSYNYKEIGFNLADDTTISVYVEDEHVITYQRDGDEDLRRVVINWDVKPGLEVRVYASNASGGALDCGATLVYDDVEG